MSNECGKSRRLNAEGLCPAPDRLWKHVQRGDLPSLLCRDPAINAAFLIHQGDMLRRAQLEARILANQPQSEIATKMTLAIETLIEFEDWFFSVRDRLAMSSWIMHEVIRRRPNFELSVGDVGCFWRFIAFVYGPVALEAYLAAVDTETLQRKGLDAYVQRETSLDPELKLLVLIERLPHPRTPQEHMRRRLLLDELVTLRRTSAHEFLSPLTLEESLMHCPATTIASNDALDLGTIDALGDGSATLNVNQQLVPQSQAV